MAAQNAFCGKATTSIHDANPPPSIGLRLSFGIIIFVSPKANAKCNQNLGEIVQYGMFNNGTVSMHTKKDQHESSMTVLLVYTVHVEAESI